MTGGGDDKRVLRFAAVVFDLDGTLVDTMTIAPTVYAETIRALGGPHVAPDTVVATWHIGATPVVLAHFLGRPVTASDLACYHRHFAAVVADVRPFPGVPELVQDLRQHGCRLGIFTAATRSTTALVLAGTGLDRLFPVVVGGDEIRAAKPAPEGLWLAGQRLGVDIGDLAYVGDADVDLECATAAGAVAVHARWGASSAALAPAPMVAHRPAEVLDLLVREDHR